jgi:hypothetical protein
VNLVSKLYKEIRTAVIFALVARLDFDVMTHSVGHWFGPDAITDVAWWL